MAAGDASAEIRVGYVQAQMVLSDLIRKKLEEAHASAAEFSNVRKHLDPAEGALLPVAGEFSRRADWSRVYSHVLTRLGDLDVKSGDLRAAEARYGRARDTATSPFQNSQLLRPDIYDRKNQTHRDYGEAVRELAWTYRKLGEVQFARHNPQAIENLTSEVCVRRGLTTLDPGNSLWAQDLAYALTKYGEVSLETEGRQLPAAPAAFQEAFHIWLGIADVRDGDARAQNDVVRGLRGLEQYYQEAGDTKLADLYRQAAEVKGATSALRGAPLSMLKREVRDVILQQDQDFVATELPQVQQAADGCWKGITRMAANGP
jgi:hypothetical protein